MTTPIINPATLSEEQREAIKELFVLVKSMFDLASIESLIQRRVIKAEDRLVKIFGSEFSSIRKENDDESKSKSNRRDS